MTWVRLDDRFFTHRKVSALTKDAKLVYLAGLTFCAENLTDGRLKPADIALVCRLVDAKPSARQELIAAGLWDAAGDGVAVHDYLLYNPSSEQVEEQRKADRDRKARSRKRSGRDPDSGRYSGAESRRDTHPDARRDSAGSPQSVTPYPSPVPNGEPSSSSPLGGDPPDDDDDRIQQALRRLAGHDLDRREAETGQKVGDRAAWLVRAVHTRADTSLGDLTDLAGRHPAASAEDLARLVLQAETPAAADSPPGDATAAASRALAERHTNPSCGACRDVRLVEDADGNAVPCPSCAPQRVSR